MDGTLNLIEIMAGKSHRYMCRKQRTLRQMTLNRCMLLWKKMKHSGFSKIVIDKNVHTALKCTPCILHTHEIQLLEKRNI